MGYLIKAAAIGALAAFSLGAASPSPDPGQVAIGIESAYDAQCAALLAGDAAAWAATIAPDFLPIMPDRKRGDAATARAGVAALLASTKIERCRIVPESIRMAGDDAIVTAGVSMSGVQRDGKSIAVEQHATDRWSRAAGSWLQKSSDVSEQIITIDGRVIRQGRRP